MSKREIARSMSTSDEVSVAGLAAHLGVHRNQVPEIAAKFNLPKRQGRFGKLDVFRNIHDVEPMLIEEALTAIRDEYSRAVAMSGSCEGTGTKPVCLIPELASISEIREALWSQGLVHVRALWVEYGYCYDSFRKKLKAGEVSLPPVAPVRLSPNRVMYRPLEIALWRRHGIAMNLPRALGGPFVKSMRRDENRQVSAVVEVSDPGKFSRQIFAGAINATDQKSAFEAGTNCLADMLHDFRL